MKGLKEPVQLMNGKNLADTRVVIEDRNVFLITVGVIVTQRHLGPAHKFGIAENDPRHVLSRNESVPKHAHGRWRTVRLVRNARLRRVPI